MKHSLRLLSQLTQHHRSKLILSSSSSSSTLPLTSQLFHTIPNTSNHLSAFQPRSWKSTAAATSTSATSSLSSDVSPRLTSDDAAIAAQTRTTSFPSLIIGADQSLQPVGSFAQAQAVYLDPDPDAVSALQEALLRTNTGVVAHYYMDVELQGVLQAVARNHPQLQGRIGIADSLKMGDMAVDMVQNLGCSNIICLGVDFMSESVQAILTKAGYGQVPVYRAATAKIGCSLAESAERDSYRAWLQHESSTSSSPSLHVVYINTSLETKAVSSSLVPTITCTSSNVLATLLQASAQIGPDLKILYGPDTYMGHNLVTLLTVILGDASSPSSGNTGWSDDRIRRELHPRHNRSTLKQLRDSIAVFPQGNCVVHHMFGAAVVETVKQQYQDAYVTAHLEVPGEMFEIAMQRSLDDRGVVGSTSDILNFITRKVQDAANEQRTTSTGTNTANQTLKFILGTEAGMVTSIVQSVGRILNECGNPQLRAEIIFPVSNDAVMGDESSELGLVPGVSGGEGCSTAGGCATCPFMKMNDLDALMNVLEMIEDRSEFKLQQHLPPDRLRGKFINGQPALELGTEAILYMRQFMKNKQLPEELVQKIMATSNNSR